MDWPLNLSIVFLMAAGLLSLTSTAPHLAGPQLLWCLLGFGIIISVANFDWRPFAARPWFSRGIYVIAIVFLALTYFIAPTIRGVRAWIVIGPFQFQMSELAKFALILLYSSFFAKGHTGIAHFKNLFLSFAYLVIPLFFVVIQPDMGTALILFGIWFCYLLVCGIKWRHLLAAAVIFSAIFVFMWNGFLENYQKDRISALFHPERDPLGVNYSVIQSKIAIGSAGFFGKGFKQGTQSQLGFLPEAQTDFIFSSFTEEWGLLGALAVLAVFFTMIFRIIKIGIFADNNFSRFICLGASLLFLLHFVLNVGSCLGLLPVIGVSFPFLSYGGSNLLINSFLVGMVQSIALHRRFQ